METPTPYSSTTKLPTAGSSTHPALGTYTNLWKYAGDAMWANPKLCVAGSSSSSSQPHLPTPSPAQAQAQRQQSTPSKGTNTNTAGSGERPTAADPSNDILSAIDSFSHYDLLKCNEHKDCNGGGHYACEPISVCHNGVITPHQKRCVRSCSTSAQSCNIGTCAFSQSSLSSAMIDSNPPERPFPKPRHGRGSGPRSRAYKSYRPGKCIPELPTWCSFPSYDPSLSNKAAEDAAFYKQGYAPCDYYGNSYDERVICYTSKNKPVRNPSLLTMYSEDEDPAVTDLYGQYLA